MVEKKCGAEPAITARAALIMNPKAGIHRSGHKKLKQIIESEARKANWLVYQTESLSALSVACQDIHRMTVPIVAIFGGDGTIDAVLTGLRRLYLKKERPRIVVLGGGTMNILASQLHLWKSPMAVFSQFLQTLESERGLDEVALRPLDVNGQLGFVFASGAAVRFLKHFYEGRPSRGRALGLFAELSYRGLRHGHRDELFRRIFKIEPARIKKFSAEGVVSNPFDEERAYDAIFASTLPGLTWPIPLFTPGTLGGPLAKMLAIGSSGQVFDLASDTLKTFFPYRWVRKGLDEGAFDDAVIEMAPHSMVSLDGEFLRVSDGRIHIRLEAPFSFVR